MKTPNSKSAGEAWHDISEPSSAMLRRAQALDDAIGAVTAGLPETPAGVGAVSQLDADMALPSPTATPEQPT